MNIKIRDLSKSFGTNCVLGHVDLDIQTSTIQCLLGASGSGKSTLLKLIMGAMDIDQGSIYIDDILVPNKVLLSKIGFMPQEEGLYTELSILENLKFFAGIQKVSKKEFESRYEQLLKTVGIFEHRKKKISDCSGGMKKRISLACALIHKPKLIILDEPTVGIDPLLRRQIWEYLHQLKKEGVTILVTTHVMDEVEQCDYAALLRNGSIIINDSIDNLYKLTNGKSLEELFFLKGERKSEVYCN